MERKRTNGRMDGWADNTDPFYKVIGGDLVERSLQYSLFDVTIRGILTVASRSTMRSSLSLTCPWSQSETFSQDSSWRLYSAQLDWWNDAPQCRRNRMDIRSPDQRVFFRWYLDERKIACEITNVSNHKLKSFCTREPVIYLLLTP